MGYLSDYYAAKDAEETSSEELDAEAYAATHAGYLADTERSAQQDGDGNQ